MEYLIRYNIMFIKHTSCLVIFIIIVVSQRPNFRSDYRYEKAFNAFYKVHTTAEPWSTAKIRCEAEGTELMVPQNLDEAEVMPVLLINVISKYDGVFIGIHDLYSERIFVTLNGVLQLTLYKGSRIMHSFVELLWGHMEPVHNRGRCIAMSRTGHLHVRDCRKPLPFLCKLSADKIVYNQECDSYNLNWTKGPNNSCYLIHVEPQNWYDAYSTCLASGGYLAVLSDRAEAGYIRGLFKHIDEIKLSNNDVAFLGFSDLFQKYHFRTVHGERIQDIGYSDWDRSCLPSSGNMVVGHRCGGTKRSGLLTTEDCDIPAMFFCEKQIKPSSRRVVGAHPKIPLKVRRAKRKIHKKVHDTPGAVHNT